jgi:hypothetical protein
MKAILMFAFLFAGCQHDSPEDIQSYELMSSQFKQWTDAAARGEKLEPGFGILATNHCFQARRDQATIYVARPLAKACDASLESIKAAAAR